MDTEYIDTGEAAQILQMPFKQSARVVLKREKVPFKRVGLVYLFRRSDVQALAEKRGGKVRPGRPRKKVSA